MKNIAAFIIIVIQCTNLSAQNVGIGISSPLYKLDVAGTVRNSYNAMTSPGLFGRLTSGGSLRVENNDNTNFMMLDGNSIQSQVGSLVSSGTSAAPLLINPYGGNVGIRTSTPNASLSVFRGNGVDGTAAFFGTNHVSHFNYSIGENTYIRGGKTGSVVYINDSHNGDVNIATGGGSINTGSGGIYSAATGGFNLVPIGVFKYSFRITSDGVPYNMSLTNEAGSIATGNYNYSPNIYTDDYVSVSLMLDNAQCIQYSKVLAIGGGGFLNLNIGEGRSCNANVTSIIQSPGETIFRIGYGADTFSLTDPSLSGTVIIYGVK